MILWRTYDNESYNNDPLWKLYEYGDVHVMLKRVSMAQERKHDNIAITRLWNILRISMAKKWQFSVELFLFFLIFA